ncbi:MAG: hypothetical protein K8M05_09130 [Deltaproteobacteria bacterium]|nr:hypothetical protein [Kofleriaceae bacterium]
MSEREEDGLTDVPVPDLLDRGGRARRIGIAAAVATLVAVVAALVTYDLARADLETTSWYAARTRNGAWRFVGFMTGLAWIVTFVGAHWFLGRRARRKDSFVAEAKAKVRRGL